MALYRLLLLLLVLVVPCFASAQTTITMQWQGRTRTYFVYVPSSYSPTVRLPVVLALHPGLSNATNHAAAAKWQEKGNAEGFISVYPNGTSQIGSSTSFSWNAYAPSSGSNVDDVGFLNAVLNQVIRQYAVDTTRLYLSGFSNGAWMTFRMGCDFTQRFAALGPLSGSWKYGKDGLCDHGGCNGSPIPGTSPPSAEANVNCVPSQKIPIMFYRGTRESSLTDRAITDPAVPYFWSLFNQCQTTPVVDNLQRNGDNIMRERYPACAANAEVVVMNVVDNSHQWHASATDEFWEFFQRFRRLPNGTVLPTAAPTVTELAFSLFPNPATSTTECEFNLKTAQMMSVEVRDLQGRVVQTLPSRLFSAGRHTIFLPTADLASGTYLIQMQSTMSKQVRRLSVIH